MIDEQKLRELATRVSQLANLEANELAQVMDDSAAAILALLDELSTLRSERTAWRVTAENAEAAVKQARIGALEEAKKAVDSEGFREPEGEYEAGYNKACDVCVSAIEYLKGKP